MSNETRLTIVGRLTDDPILRFTPSGAAVANLTIASNARTFDKNTNTWKDEPAAFWRCSIWRDAAENVAESLQKGHAVVAVGVIKPRSYDTKEGEKRDVIEVELDAIGPDLRWNTAKVNKANRAQVGGGSVSAAPAADPWAQPAPAQQPAPGGWGTDEAPF